MVNNDNVNKMKIDKQNGEVCYNDAEHKYWTKGSGLNCISVTTLIHKFTNFDEAFWSKYKALERILGEDIFSGPLIGKKKRGPSSDVKTKLLDKNIFKYEYLEEYGITKEELDKVAEEIISEWHAKRDKSCIRGSKIHKDYELKTLKKEYSWTEDYYLPDYTNYEVLTSNIFNPGNYVLPEALISRISDDGTLRVAGQSDLIIVEGEFFDILDFKTNEEIKLKSFFNTKLRKSSRMKFPLNNLDDVNYWHYTLQLSTYAWMVMKNNPKLKLRGLYLLHHDHSDNKTVYKLNYLEKEVERMLSFYKRDIEHKEFKERNTPCLWLK